MTASFLQADFAYAAKASRQARQRVQDAHSLLQVAQSAQRYADACLLRVFAIDADMEVTPLLSTMWDFYRSARIQADGVTLNSDMTAKEAVWTGLSDLSIPQSQRFSDRDEARLFCKFSVWCREIVDEALEAAQLEQALSR